jgi:hypothetical protein
VVVEEVDLVDVDDAAVRLCEQAGLERPLALLQRSGDVDRARHPVLRRVQRQVDDPATPAHDGQLPVALAAGRARRRRIAGEGTVRDDDDLR